MRRRALDVAEPLLARAVQQLVCLLTEARARVHLERHVEPLTDRARDQVAERRGETRLGEVRRVDTHDRRAQGLDPPADAEADSSKEARACGSSVRSAVAESCIASPASS